MAIHKITASAQLKSANAKTDIENHSGKKNRETYAHKNPDIVQERSKYNVELDFHNDRELLEKHYKTKIEKHNKNNNSAARRWDLDKCLASFEGKEVNLNGKKTKNVRWATASQISYFGGKDSLNPVLKELEKAGASPEAIREAYASGYEEYVKGHNEKFWTLPIYHSDIHFDETTPHGHDAIVVMGHTAKGQASDSINNALGEMYGYPADWKGKQANLSRYRDENDAIMFDAIGPKLEALGAAHGLDIKFEFLRTGQTGSLNMQDYKTNAEYDRIEQLLLDKEAELKEVAGELETVKEMQEQRTKAQKEMTGKNKERKRDLDAREKALSALENDLALREASVIAREKEQREKEQEAIKREAEMSFRIEKNNERLVKAGHVVTAVTMAVLKDDKKFKGWYDKAEEVGALRFIPEKLSAVLADSISRAPYEKGRSMGDKTFINQQIARQEAENDGPEL